ncbi:MAG TPA: hypothetical protein VG148_16840 [Pyrinomonadaceae bacterium]|nr:hypothetical protein [Pyrinomonadaceae bacterium]
MYSITYPCRVAVFVVLAALPLRAQHAGGTVTVTGRVSAVAAVSAGSAARVVEGDARVSARTDGARGLVVSVSGTRGGETRLELPIQLRSNVGFALTASCVTGGAALSALSVEVSDAGEFVHPGAAGRVVITSAFDGRPGARPASGVGPDLSSPVTILTGPPISMSGTLDSPNNMIEVVLRVVFAAPPGTRGWHAELSFSATPHVGTGRPTPSGHGAGKRE